jgi:soluble lytic murein transglycosylase-like protein
LLTGSEGRIATEEEGFLYQRPDGGLSRVTPGRTSLKFVQSHDDVSRLYRPGVGQLVRTLLRGVALTALLVAGTVFTLKHQRQYKAAGNLLTLPGAVISATAPTEDPFRISQVIKRYTRNSSDADRIAKAVVAEGKRKKIDPAMIVGIMMVESEMNPRARSFVGARGLMQVMPFHRGRWGCKSRDLYDIETNICLGVSVLADNIRRSPNLRVALQRYNGCVRGTNTPGCSSYTRKVLRARDNAARQILTVAD